MPNRPNALRAVGIDFGTTNSVVACLSESGEAELIDFAARGGTDPVFRSALCFWQDDAIRGGLGHEAGPWAVSEFLDFPEGSRFLQSFKSLAGSGLFESANLFGKRLKFEDLGQIFLRHLLDHAGDALDDLPERVLVGRPVRYVGARPDPVLARVRYDAMFAMLGREVQYVYEPLGAAYSFASRLTDPATLLVADFGGGTSDFSVVRLEAQGSERHGTPLGSAGIGIAGDRFDYRIMDRLVLPLLGKGGTYCSFGKLVDIPSGHFADFSDWSRLSLMRNRRTLDELSRLESHANDAAAIRRLIAVVDNELGYSLYETIGRLKRRLSSDTHAPFHFEGPGITIEAEVARSEFESWIEADMAKIAGTIDEALANAGLGPDQIDHVFLTGGSSLIPAVRRMFEERFGADKIASGEELTSIAHGLALMAQDPDLEQWVMREEVPA